MTYAIACFGILGLLAFLYLQPKYKVFISFFLMMQFFDLGPGLLFGMYVWDYGAILMLVTAVDVFLRTPVLELPKHGYITVFKIFLAWLLICFLWSLLIYQYPVLHTIKNARYLLVGYSMTLIFIRVFSVQPESFEFLMKWFYWLTFVLMPVVLLQYLLDRPLLFGLIVEYEGAVRALPIFLPFCILYFWVILVKLLSSQRLAAHETIYLTLAASTIALTFTRGIYIAVMLTTVALMWTMSWDRTVKALSALKAMTAGALMIVVLLAFGAGGKVVDRIASGLHLLSSGDTASVKQSKENDDTFNGRLGLAAERFSLVWAKNPILGYGFIHEDDVPSELRGSLRFGTPLSGTAADPTAYSRFNGVTDHYTLGFYTADVAWADIAISTGWLGVLLLIIVVLVFVLGHYRQRGGTHPMGYAVRTALFLQVLVAFLLTFNSNSFYSNVHIVAFLLAGYALTGDHPVKSTSPTTQVSRPANLMT